MDMDIEPIKTHVYVHSPFIEYSTGGNYYTSYAISLTTNNPSFTHAASHTRRRYSEFVRLRQLLASHNPIIQPPPLPPKSFFNRFNQNFIQERTKGLQKFLQEVLAVPVYLSDKSLHMFLQSSSSMSQIDEECLGDIPAPQLLESSNASFFSESSSNKSSEQMEAENFARALQTLVIDNCQIDNKTQGGTSTTVVKNSSPIKSNQNLVSALRKESSRPFSIPRKGGSLDSSPSSSPSSLEVSYSSSMDPVKERHVSFDDKVKIAIVTNYGISMVNG